jgi:delta14-sterol reductase
MEKLGHSTLIYVGFVAFTFVGTKFLPGKVVEDSLQADGTRKSYKLNGLVLFLGTSLVLAGLSLFFNFSLAPLHAYFWELFIVANLFAFTWTAILYVSGKRSQLTDSRSTIGKILKDLWFGVELNPTWLGVDLKMFAYQPSLIGLGLFNASFAYAQYETYGQISLQMWMFQAFWWLYLASHYYYEEFMLSTWDIIAEKFGFMLIWGDLVLVPFFYSLIGWFLVDRLSPIPIPVAIAITLLYLFGLWLFRGANLQKYRFKKDPHTKIWGQPAKALEGKLLISGWWGIGRKLNYTGEICLYLAIAILTGFNSVIPYLLPLWLGSLLIHRSWRDDRRCRAKYKDLWDTYCAKARFRIIPFIY